MIFWLSMFLVGPFSVEGKMPYSYSDLFFFKTTDLTLIGSLFRETPETTKAKSGQCKLSAKGPLSFFTFQGNLQNRRRLKGGPLSSFLIFCNK